MSAVFFVLVILPLLHGRSPGFGPPPSHPKTWSTGTAYRNDYGEGDRNVHVDDPYARRR